MTDTPSLRARLLEALFLDLEEQASEDDNSVERDGVMARLNGSFNLDALRDAVLEELRQPADAGARRFIDAVLAEPALG